MTQMFQEYKDVLTVGDLAKMLDVGRNTAYDFVKTGKAHSIKVKSQIRIPKGCVIVFVLGECNAS